MASLSHGIRQRKRKRCPKCNQELSHSAYARHQNPAVCPDRSYESDAQKLMIEGPGVELPSHSAGFTQFQSMNDTESPIASSMAEEETEHDKVVDHEDFEVQSEQGLDCSGDSEDDSEDDSEMCLSDDDEVAILDELHNEFNPIAVSCEQSAADDGDHHENMKLIAVYVCMFLSFFQMCFRISEHGISLLLAFLRALLLAISSLCEHSLDLKILRDALPHNVYCMRKLWVKGIRSKHLLSVPDVIPFTSLMTA